MGLLTKIFGGKKDQERGLRPGEEDRNPSHEQRLKEDFGLEYGEDGWVFEGGQIVDQMVSQLSKPTICWATMKSLAEEARINHVCIVASARMATLVFNRKPTPICFVTGLDASGVGSLVATAIEERGKQVVIYRGTWLVTL